MNLEEVMQQFKQALGLFEKNEFDQAREIFEQLSSEIDPTIDNLHREIYAKSQLCLGSCYQQQGKLKKALRAYENVPKEEYENYAHAQLIIAMIYYHKKNKLDDAINILKNILPIKLDIYEKAQFVLGILYSQKKDLEKAKKAYQRVSIENIELYEKSQFNLGSIYKEQDQLKDAENALKKISQKQKIFYAKAQFNLGLIYKQQGDLKLAIDAYRNIPQEELRLYIQGRWNILMIYLDQKEFIKFENDLKSIDFEEEKYLSEMSYHLNLYRKISSKNLIEKLNPLEMKITDFLNKLLVDQSEDDLIAHYTAPSIAYLMLDHKNQEHPSKLRLNPTDFMNDPTEGALINQLFSLKTQEKPNAQIEQHKSFIGCFTLHHDSLNQFRLYGKENQREASGVSLVLNREQLFESESNFKFLTHHLLTLQKESVDSENIAGTQKLSEDKPTQQQSADLKLPLFRCIYFDPDSGLIHVAQREEWTFCREKGSCQDNGWSDYKDKIDQVNDSVRVLIAEIKALIEQINPAENSDEAELIKEILLPLRYLIKHYAFKEEQECRTIYITQWNDEKIQLDPNLKRVYVDYQSILPAMEKIFLSVGALHHESTLQYLGQNADKAFIVKRSHNPFRT